MWKKKLILCLGLLSSLAVLASCGQKKVETKPTETKTAKSTKTTKSTAANKKSSNQDDKKGTEETVNLEESQQIGRDDLGYVYIPKDWYPFTDLSGGDAYQYSDASAYNVVTMYSYTKEVLGVEKIDDAAAEQVASSYYRGLESQGTFDQLTGSKVDVSGYEAYQVYGVLKSDGKILCAWIFVTEKSDKVYLISLEGDTETFLSVLPSIQTTWSETK